MDQTENTERSNVSENKAETSDMATGNAPETTEKDSAKTGTYRFLAVLFALLSVGGLFLGLLGKAWSAFAPTVFFTRFGTTLSGSLIGYAIDFMKFMGTGAFYDAMHVGAASALAALVELVLVFALFLTTIFAVVACFAALCSKKRARRFALISGTAVLLTYMGLFLWSYFSMSAAGAPLGEVYDVPTAVITIVALVGLSVTAVATNKHCGANVAMLISALLIAYLICYPGALPMAVAGGIFSLENSAFAKIALFFFMLVLAFNIVVSAVRLFSAKRYAFDSFRFALQLFCTVFMVIAFISDPIGGDTWAIFRGSQLFYTLGILALSILALTVAIFLASVTKKAALLKDYAETFPGFTVEETAEPEAEETNADADADADDVPEEEIAVQAEEADEAAEGEMPEALRDEIELQEEAPMSEFERRMQALARGEQPDYTASPNVPPQPPQQPYMAPSRAGMPVQQRNVGGYPDQYTYDPFINSLSPQEKNEFGDLFIACKAGKVEGLPIYKIGGNNEEFFRKVFIFLGKFRNDISAELLDKLYLYVSKNG